MYQSFLARIKWCPWKSQSECISILRRNKQELSKTIMVMVTVAYGYRQNQLPGQAAAV